MTARVERRRLALTRLLAGLGVGSGVALLTRPRQIVDAVARISGALAAAYAAVALAVAPHPGR